VNRTVLGRTCTRSRRDSTMITRDSRAAATANPSKRLPAGVAHASQGTRRPTFRASTRSSALRVRESRPRKPANRTHAGANRATRQLRHADCAHVSTVITRDSRSLAIAKTSKCVPGSVASALQRTRRPEFRCLREIFCAWMRESRPRNARQAHSRTREPNDSRAPPGRSSARLERDHA
jgi:hypothetical protein